MIKGQKKDPAPIFLNLQESLDRLLEQANTKLPSVNERKILKVQIRRAILDLDNLLNKLDPIRQPVALFDPSNPKIVGRFVSLALVAQSRFPLANVDRFYGSGVYAIYYHGTFPLYESLSKSETPIYVGQVAPSVPNARTPIEQGEKLSGRLIEHHKNIAKATTNLSIDDFEYRALVVQSGWETAAEDYLIHLFRPIWNNQTKLVFGLGKHGDSSATRANKRPPLDTMHPGRDWAKDAAIADAKSIDRITSELITHFSKYPVFADIDALLHSFIEELKQI
jgi:hypothetical protein